VPITRSLVSIRTEVEYCADIRGQVVADGRHPPDDVNRTINDVYRLFQTLLVTKGYTFYVQESSLAALPTARADTNEEYSLIDWPAAAVLIKRVDVYSGSGWIELEEIDWTQLRHVPGCSSNSHPRYFAPKSHGTVSGSTLTAGKIALAPFGSNGTFKISYLPAWTDITTDAHLFLFPSEEGVQWVVWQTVRTIAARDNDSQKRWKMATDRTLECEAKIGSFVSKVIQTGPSQMRRSPTYRSG
jgi:hypothetical protein